MANRTTIELSQKNKAKLVSAAARRGLKGYSLVIDEALELYFQDESLRSEKVKAALAVQGSLSDSEADSLTERVSKVRAQWR
jgi:metal-responsive CopG/Arc/MetJ family transcriptional regulator